MILREIESVCPDCLRRLTGLLVKDGDRVRLKKTCPEHGAFTATIWRGSPDFNAWYRPKPPFAGGVRRPSIRGCPLDCGLCDHHGQRTCTALVEITSRCNLHCPVCFADSGGSAPDPTLDDLQRMFSDIIAQTGGCNLQLSGGEPTVRDDLPAVVAAAKAAGFDFIQLNTNGIRLAEDPDLAPRLLAAGLSSVFLQFDGVAEAAFLALRGKRLFRQKCRAIAALAAAGLGIVLVPTIVRGVNLEQVGDIVRFGLEHLPHIRGVHFQPISYFGRFPASFRPEHVTLPELMGQLAAQSRGTMLIDDFRPPGCEHSLCSFSARYLLAEDGQLRRLGGAPCTCPPKTTEEGALTAIGVTSRQWASPPVPATADDAPANDLDRFLHRARTHTFSVSAMAFQDCWSLNLERLQGCCIHVARPDGRLIPFCSFNLTARNGRALHRGQP